MRFVELVPPIPMIVFVEELLIKFILVLKFGIELLKIKTFSLEPTLNKEPLLLIIPI